MQVNDAYIKMISTTPQPNKENVRKRAAKPECDQKKKKKTGKSVMFPVTPKSQHFNGDDDSNGDDECARSGFPHAYAP